MTVVDTPLEIGSPSHLIRMIEKRAEVIGALLSRWEDEKEYEDIEDYRDALNLSMRGTSYKFVRLNRSWVGIVSCSRTGSTLEVRMRGGRLSVRRAR